MRVQGEIKIASGGGVVAALAVQRSQRGEHFGWLAISAPTLHIRQGLLIAGASRIDLAALLVNAADRHQYPAVKRVGVYRREDGNGAVQILERALVLMEQCVAFTDIGEQSPDHVWTIVGLGKCERLLVFAERLLRISKL